VSVNGPSKGLKGAGSVGRASTGAGPMGGDNTNGEECPEVVDWPSSLFSLFGPNSSGLFADALAIRC
jgi:hypothetical protein